MQNQWKAKNIKTDFKIIKTQLTLQNIFFFCIERFPRVNPWKLFNLTQILKKIPFSLFLRPEKNFPKFLKIFSAWLVIIFQTAGFITVMSFSNQFKNFNLEYNVLVFFFFFQNLICPPPHSHAFRMVGSIPFVRKISSKYEVRWRCFLHAFPFFRKKKKIPFSYLGQRFISCVCQSKKDILENYPGLGFNVSYIF